MKTTLLLTTALCLCISPAFAQTATPTTATPAATPTATPAATPTTTGSTTPATTQTPGVTPAPAASNAAAVANTPVNMKGMNGTSQDFIAAWGNILKQFPDMSGIRVNSGGNMGTPDTFADIDTVVKNYTGAGIAVEIEDHTGNPSNTAWYTQLATTYKGNPLVYLEMPNEPTADAATTAQNQIGLINAIRQAGFTNWIGIQPDGGFDFSNMQAVVTALAGDKKLFVTPHAYYYQNDPNGAAQEVQNYVQQAQALGLPMVIDEFGNDGGDGITPAPQGMSMLLAVIAATEGSNGGTVQSGGIFWALDNGNHPDGTDSACMAPDCSQLTPIGLNPLQPWLSKGTPAVVANASQMPALDSTNAAVGQQQAANDAAAANMANGTTPTPTAAGGTGSTDPTAAGAPTPTGTPSASDIAAAEQQVQQEAAQLGQSVQFFSSVADAEASIEAMLKPLGLVAIFEPLNSSGSPTNTAGGTGTSPTGTGTGTTPTTTASGTPTGTGTGADSTGENTSTTSQQIQTSAGPNGATTTTGQTMTSTGNGQPMTTTSGTAPTVANPLTSPVNTAGTTPSMGTPSTTTPGSTSPTTTTPTTTAGATPGSTTPGSTGSPITTPQQVGGTSPTTTNPITTTPVATAPSSTPTGSTLPSTTTPTTPSTTTAGTPGTTTLPSTTTPGTTSPTSTAALPTGLSPAQTTSLISADEALVQQDTTTVNDLNAQIASTNAQIQQLQGTAPTTTASAAPTQ